jgi:NAD(P)-dependent dehydrogenase (short-subunit alcohol dehydrogenase family)
MRLENKTTLVTGASKGMGESEARLFASQGANVVLCDVDQREGEKTAKSITESGGTAEFMQCDVTNESDWEKVINATTNKFGSLDVLVNNAGLSSGSTEDHLSSEWWHKIMDVNATGVFLGTKIAAEIMKEQQSGSIINISSIMGFVGGENGHPAYHASKGAVRIFSKAMAVKYGPYGVRVNSVHPGFMPPMSSSYRSPSIQAENIKRTPLRRTGEVIEVAYGVLFLASDESSFITGTELVIDGGFIAQ